MKPPPIDWKKLYEDEAKEHEKTRAGLRAYRQVARGLCHIGQGLLRVFVEESR